MQRSRSIRRVGPLLALPSNNSGPGRHALVGVQGAKPPGLAGVIVKRGWNQTGAVVMATRASVRAVMWNGFCNVGRPRYWGFSVLAP